MKILYTQKRITEMVNTLANQVQKANPKKDIVLVGSNINIYFYIRSLYVT